MQIIKSEAIEAVQYLRFWYGGVSTRGKHAKSHRMFSGRRVLLRQLIHPTGNLVNHQNRGWDGEEQGTDLGSEVDVLLDDEVSTKQLLSVEAGEDGADDGELGGDACNTREMGVWVVRCLWCSTPSCEGGRRWAPLRRDRGSHDCALGGEVGGGFLPGEWLGENYVWIMRVVSVLADGTLFRIWRQWIRGISCIYDHEILIESTAVERSEDGLPADYR